MQRRNGDITGSDCCCGMVFCSEAFWLGQMVSSDSFRASHDYLFSVAKDYRHWFDESVADHGFAHQRSRHIFQGVASVC